jgi:N-acetyl-1-D-myo-inositol-2-amino-2-deoxy-alpha-D-glucopyranoside deacetylase
MSSHRGREHNLAAASGASDGGQVVVAGERDSAGEPGPDGGLLAVHAHPDDETLATGALLATWAAAGRPVTVVTCTRGERGEVIDTPSHPTGLAHLEGDGPALAAHRETELAAALAALGVIDHVFLDGELSGRGGRIPARHPDNSAGERYEDSGMAWVAPGIAGPAPDSGPTAFSRVTLDAAAARLAAVVRDRRPAVVATYEAGGGYGHPDHVRAHEVTVRALELAADPGALLPGTPWVAELWQAVIPAGELRAARRMLAGAPAVRPLSDAGLRLPDPGAELPPVARDDARLAQQSTVRVAVAPVLDRLLAAMAAHATQVQHATPLDPGAGGPVACYALSNGVLAPVLARETYLRR